MGTTTEGTPIARSLQEAVRDTRWRVQDGQTAANATTAALVLALCSPTRWPPCAVCAGSLVGKLQR